MRKLQLFLKEFKEKDSKNWIIKFFQLLLFNNLFKLSLSGLIGIIGAIGINAFSTESMVFYVLFLIGFGGILLFAVVMLIYAFIINPIRNLLKK